MHGRFKNDQFLKEKSKNLRKCCPTLIGTTFSTKFKYLTLKFKIAVLEIYLI